MNCISIKKTFFFILLTSTTFSFAQQSYYNDVNMSLRGEDLYSALQHKIDQASATYTYGDFRDTYKYTDLDPENANNVLLIYGYDDNAQNCNSARSRNKNNFGGGSCQINREHTFARSLASPPMGSTDNSSSGIVADPHNLRPSDVERNSLRGNRPFGDGSGNSGVLSDGSWYPGDEWKGDVARIIMYMYLRYGERCLPEYVGTGTKLSGTKMMQLFIDWNVEDPVSEYEDQRNPILEDEYGNRNPFIDNPYLATAIWGGTPAEDRWGNLSFKPEVKISYSAYPNPASYAVTIAGNRDIDTVVVYDTQGKKVAQYKNQNTFSVKALKTGVYFMSITSEKNKQIIKLLVE